MLNWLIARNQAVLHAKLNQILQCMIGENVALFCQFWNFFRSTKFCLDSGQWVSRTKLATSKIAEIGLPDTSEFLPKYW